MFDGILNATLRQFPPLGLHKRISNFPYLLILLIRSKRKPPGLTPRFYSLEGELIHWVDKAKTCD